MCLFGLIYVKSVKKVGLKLKFSLEKFCWFGKKQYLCTRFPNEGSD